MTVEKFRLPVGRIVGGNPALAQNKTNFQTKKPELNDKGQPIQEWRCDIAIPKDKFMAEVWPVMFNEVRTAFPINPQTGQPNVSRDFSWKYVDGDSPEIPKQSKLAYNAREGYPGHIILKIRTEAFAPPIFKFENGAWTRVEANQIKCGDYVIANVDIKVHTNNDGGLYFNPNGFELVGYGTAIASTATADPTQLFGSGEQRPQLPPGASLTPVGAPMGAPMPAMMSQQPMPAMMSQQMGVPQYQQPMPAAGHVAPQGMPQVPQGYGSAQAAPGYPSNPLPPPAHDFVQNAGQYPTAAPAGYGQPPSAAPQGVGFAPSATSFPTSGIPGIPPAR